MLPFKDGALKIAEKTGCAIIPMSMNNTQAIFEGHLPFVRKTHVVLEYGKNPFIPTSLTSRPGGTWETTATISSRRPSSEISPLYNFYFVFTFPSYGAIIGITFSATTNTKEFKKENNEQT